MRTCTWDCSHMRLVNLTADDRVAEGVTPDRWDNGNAYIGYCADGTCLLDKPLLVTQLMWGREVETRGDQVTWGRTCTLKDRQTGQGRLL